MILAPLALLALLAGSTAPIVTPPKPEPTLRLFALYGAASGMDLYSTEWALGHNPRAYEANPLGRTRGARIAVAAGVTVLAVWATQDLQKHGHRKAAKVVKWAFILAHVGLAVNNVRLGAK